MAHITVECPVCEETFDLEVNVTPFIPARTYGLPENCSEAEGGEVELDDYAPKACPECKTVWTPEQKDDVDIAIETAIEEFEYEDDGPPEPEREDYEDR